MCLFAVLGATERRGAGADDDVAFFEAKIRPVLVERCHECHSSQAPKPKGGLRVDSRAALRAGGTSGPAVVPGDLDASLLYQAITAADGVEPMPPKGRLSPAEIADFRRWITIGAPDPREEPATATSSPAQAAAAQSHDWWSLKPVEQPSVPSVRHGNGRLAQEPDRRLHPGQAHGKRSHARPRGRPPHVDSPALV